MHSRKPNALGLTLVSGERANSHDATITSAVALSQQVSSTLTLATQILGTQVVSAGIGTAWAVLAASGQK